LKGKEISIEARIIAVADAYDAMTSDRTYRKDLSKEEAVEEIKRCSGTQFDPEIAKIFTNVIGNYK
jgi:HD-GYP domain-containing protein (c-di-GMP phosphodiesterase class II)